MTLAEWRAALEGHANQVQQRRREQAWVVSHLLIAAGCEPDKVTPAQLLGEKITKRQRVALDPEVRKARARLAILERIRKEREKRGGNGGIRTAGRSHRVSASYCPSGGQSAR